MSVRLCCCTPARAGAANAAVGSATAEPSAVRGHVDQPVLRTGRAACLRIMLALVEVLMAVLNWHHLTCAAAAPTLDPRPVLLGRSLCRPDPAARDQQTGGGNGENRAGPAPQDDSYLESYGLSVEILMLVAFLRHSWMPPEDASVRGIQAAIPRGERCGARQHATRGHAPQATRPPHVQSIQFRASPWPRTHFIHTAGRPGHFLAIRLDSCGGSRTTREEISTT